MKRKKPNPEFQFMVRWLASKGVEISPDAFSRIEGKFHHTILPPEDQANVDAILRVSAKHYDEFMRVSREAMKIKRRRLGK